VGISGTGFHGPDAFLPTHQQCRSTEGKSNALNPARNNRPPASHFLHSPPVGCWLEFNVPFQHKYGYIRDERSGVESYPLTQ